MGDGKRSWKRASHGLGIGADDTMELGFGCFK